MTSYGIIEYNSNGNIYKQLERINKGIIKVSYIKLISFYFISAYFVSDMRARHTGACVRNKILINTKHYRIICLTNYIGRIGKQYFVCCDLSETILFS